MILKCELCLGESADEAWDKKTLSICSSRQQRRLFRGIAGTKGDKRWYVCPLCDEKSTRNKISEVHDVV